MLKTTVMLILSAAMLLAASDSPNKKGQKPKVAPAASAVTIPAGATEVEPNLYRHTEADGKTWLYRRTPFGISKWEDKPAAQHAVDTSTPVHATDLGDTVQFEKNTPFGKSKWVRKKSELTDEEREWLAKAPSRTPEQK